MKRKITIVLFILFTLQSFSQVGTVFTAGSIKYKITGVTTVEVNTNPTSIEGAIVIPETVSYESANYSVTSIGNNAFNNCVGLTSITIPNSVTNIGDFAFSYCSGLTSINIPNSVTNIGRYAFRYCYGLTSFTIPNTVTTINDGLFYDCRNLASVDISNSVTSIGSGAFNTCIALTSIIIPNTVTSIGRGAFSGCTALTLINIPNSVTNIGDLAFSSCFSLSIVTVNWTNPLAITSSVFEGLTLSTISLNVPIDTTLAFKTAAVWKEFYSISEPVGQFQLGQKFTVNGINYYVRKAILPYEVAVDRNAALVGAVVIPFNVTYLENSFAVTNIGVGAFSGCSGLTSVTIPNTVTSIAASVFKNCSGLISVGIPNSVTSIGANAFDSCISLTSVTIPDSVTVIGIGAFQSCSALTSVTIPSSLTSISNSAFSSCINLTTVNIPNSVVNIGIYAFSYCRGLTSITIPNSVKTIGDYAFSYCRGLTSITIPNSVTSIGVYTFRACSNLTSVIIPNSVTSIGLFAFGDCTNLSSVSIGNSVTSVGSYAFYKCTSLTSVSIGNPVTSIDRWAFEGCTALTSVTVNWTTPLNINRDVFYRLNLSLMTLNVPAGTVTAYKSALVWKEFGTIRELPVVGQKFAANGINYVVTKVTLPYEVEVGSNTSFVGTAVIPTIVSNLENAFAVTAIANNAFENCTGLTSVDIPNSATSIGALAFANCTGLTSITVNYITPLTINRNVFEGLNLSTITLNVPAKTELAYKNAAVWNEFGTILAQTFKANGINYIVTKATLPYEVAVDKNTDFVGAASIPSTVSDTGNTFTVTSILSNAFINSTRLTSVVIPKSVASIGNYAFSNCTGLTLVTVDWATPLSINRNVFNLLDLSTRTLNVPTGTVTTYKSDLVWKEFNPILSLPVLGQTFAANGINYIVTKATLPYEVAVGINSSFVGTAAIPTTVSDLENAFAVTAIANNAFENCIGLTSVDIPNSATSIGASAFAKCIGLTSISVNYTTPLIINRNVFEGLDITTIKLNVPAGTAATYKSAIVWKEFNPITEPPILGLSFKVNGINYYVTKATLPYEAEVGSNKSFIGTATIPTTVIDNGNSFAVTAISNSAFLNCKGLTSITIPNSVTNIGDYAFRICSNLKAVTIPNSITSIGSYTFNECTSLTSIKIPNSVTSIGYSAIAYCISLTSVTIPNSVTNIGDYAFWACTGLTSVIIPNSLSSIGVGVFSYCNKLKSVSIPNSVTSIGAKAFSYSGLTSITIPNSVTGIGIYAFENCTSLTSITIPSSVWTIEHSSFSMCYGLTSVTVQWTTPLAIPSSVFYDINLSKVTLKVPQGTETIYKSTTVWRDFGTTVTLGTNSFSTNTLPFYPNPTQSQINFSQEINNLEVFDGIGRKVKSFQNPSRSFDVSNLTKGVYVLKWETADGESSSQKMLKQ